MLHAAPRCGACSRHRAWLAPLGVTLLVCATILLPAPARAVSPAIVLVLGDSLSAGYGVAQGQGWVALLEQRLSARQRPWKVVNASISGDTTSGGAARLPAALAAHGPDIVVLELGGNDGLRGQPLPMLHSNLETMIRLSRSANSAVLLLGLRIPPNLGPVYSERFEDVFRTLHEQHEVPFVAFLLEGIALDSRLMQADGIHPTAAAQQRLLDNVWPVLEPLVVQVENGG